jgi:hypothetical protein
MNNKNSRMDYTGKFIINHYSLLKDTTAGTPIEQSCRVQYSHYGYLFQFALNKVYNRGDRE